jgi:hypothetical protein
MNGRNNFYRLQHWKLAERQRYLTELESLGAQLRADVERLRDDIDQAGGADDVHADNRIHSLFIRPLLDRRDKLLRSITEIDGQIVEARATVVMAQQEVRLFEGTLVHRGLRFEERLTRRSRRSI